MAPRALQALVLVVALIFAGVALAQDVSSDHRFVPTWDDTPTSYDCWGNYPRSARGNSVSGVVHMCCVPRQDRRLDCSIAFEWPRNRHFGEAALRVARRFRLTAESYSAYRADPNAWMQVPVLWEPITPTRNRAEVLAAMDPYVRGLCAPSSNLAARLPSTEPPSAEADGLASRHIFRCPTMLDRE